MDYFENYRKKKPPVEEDEEPRMPPEQFRKLMEKVAPESIQKEGAQRQEDSEAMKAARALRNNRHSYNRIKWD